jgi:hypothetical protein
VQQNTTMEDEHRQQMEEKQAQRRASNPVAQQK